MSATVRALVPAVLPPMHLEIRRPRRSARPAVLPQFARVSYAVAALALPSLGLAFANGIPRTDTGWAKHGIVTAITLGEITPSEGQRTAESTDRTPRYRMSSIRTR